MAFGMIHRSEMQVLSVKFWRCSPISVASVHAQGARSGRLSRANARADRGQHINLRSIHLLCRPPQARTAAVTHLPSAPSAHTVPVWRARANTKTRDYRTFESAHRAQTTCAPDHQQTRKQAPQSVAQWLLPFSRNVPPLLLAPPAPGPQNRARVSTEKVD